MLVNSIDNNVYSKKTSKLNNLVTGALVDLKLSVPVLSQYTMGDFFSKQTEIAQNLTGLQDNKEAGPIKKIGKGFITQLVYSLPVIGTYKVGKAKVNHENLKDVIEVEKHNSKYYPKKKGMFKTYMQGLGEKIKLCIPVYNVYYVGKIANETKNMVKDSQILSTKNY